jgi:hypothetical protein
MSEKPSETPDPVPCHLCGKESVMDVNGAAWCEGCLHANASCCGESDISYNKIHK